MHTNSFDILLKSVNYSANYKSRKKIHKDTKKNNKVLLVQGELGVRIFI